MFISLLFAGLLVIALYGFILVIYRLTLHPLARFPGPKLAGATRWYEFYHDIIAGEGGQFALEIDRMHNVYGPIVRINPDEIHIRDSDYFSVFYSGVRHKYGWAANMVGAEASSFGTTGHDLHKARRSANANYLSKRSVLAKEKVISDAMENVLQILRSGGPHTVVDLHPLLLAFTTEVVRQFTLNQSSHLFEDAKARKRWLETMHASLVSVPILKQFNWIMTIANLLPLAFLRIAAPPIAELISLHQATTKDAQDFLDNADKQDSGASIFHTIYHSSLPQSEKTAFRMSQEVFTIAAAAGNTTVHSLLHGVYFLASNPDALTKFQQAVRSFKDEIPGWSELSAHPYIRATIKEVLRLRGLVAGRSPLQAPAPLQYHQWFIPKLSAVSLSPRDVLLDPKIFKDPMSFNPERWLEDSATLDQYLVPFGKGSRNCQGLELAWAEMYVCLGSLFRNFDIEVVELDYDRDLLYTRECIIAMPREDSKGVRIKARPVDE